MRNEIPPISQLRNRGCSKVKLFKLLSLFPPPLGGALQEQQHPDVFAADQDQDRLLLLGLFFGTGLFESRPLLDILYSAFSTAHDMDSADASASSSISTIPAGFASAYMLALESVAKHDSCVQEPLEVVLCLHGRQASCTLAQQVLIARHLRARYKASPDPWLQQVDGNGNGNGEGGDDLDHDAVRSPDPSPGFGGNSQAAEQETPDEAQQADHSISTATREAVQAQHRHSHTSNALVDGAVDSDDHRGDEEGDYIGHAYNQDSSQSESHSEMAPEIEIEIGRGLLQNISRRGVDEEAVNFSNFSSLLLPHNESPLAAEGSLPRSSPLLPRHHRYTTPRLDWDNNDVEQEEDTDVVGPLTFGSASAPVSLNDTGTTPPPAVAAPPTAPPEVCPVGMEKSPLISSTSTSFMTLVSREEERQRLWIVDPEHLERILNPATWLNDELVNAIVSFAVAHEQGCYTLPSTIFSEQQQSQQEIVAQSRNVQALAQTLRHSRNMERTREEQHQHQQQAHEDQEGENADGHDHHVDHTHQAPGSALRMESLLLVLNVNQAHWVSVTLDLGSSRWSMMDSLPDQAHSQAAFRWVEAIVSVLEDNKNDDNAAHSPLAPEGSLKGSAQSRSASSPAAERWAQDAPAACPRQPNKSDCGIYVMVHALRRAAGLDTTGPIHGPAWRYIVHALARATSVRTSCPSDLFQLPVFPPNSAEPSLTVMENMNMVGAPFDALQTNFFTVAKSFITQLRTKAKDLRMVLTAFEDACAIFNALSLRRDAAHSTLVAQASSITDAQATRAAARTELRRLGWGWTLDQETAWMAGDAQLQGTRRIVQERLASLEAGWARVDGLLLADVVSDLRGAVEPCELTAQSIKASIMAAAQEVNTW